MMKKRVVYGFALAGLLAGFLTGCSKEDIFKEELLGDNSDTGITSEQEPDSDADEEAPPDMEEKTEEDAEESPEEESDAVESPDEEEAAEEEAVQEDQPIIRSHSVSRDDFSRSTNNDRKIEIYFDRVVFDGSDDTTIWLNGQMESMEATYCKEMTRYIETDLASLEEMQGSEYYDVSDWCYSPYELESVYYDDHYVSIEWYRYWYGGGPHGDSEWVSVNYDLNSKAEITLYDLLGENAYDIIKNELIAEYDDQLGDAFDYSKMDDIVFWFDENTIYLNFGEYVLIDVYAAGVQQISIPRPDTN